MTDDVWGDTEELRSTEDLKRIHTKQGYLDGLTKAQESSLQDGFDAGFPNGALLGKEVGRILAIINCSNQPELFEQAKKELNITKVLLKTYFDEDLNFLQHPELQKWQKIANDINN